MAIASGFNRTVYSSDLGKMALNAAIALDDMILGKDNVDIAPVTLFTETIRNSIDRSDDLKKLKDVTLVPIYVSALTSTTGSGFNDTCSLLDTLLEVVKTTELSTHGNKYTAREFRDFCLALHGALIRVAPVDRRKSEFLPLRH
jgi:hypothetical protein